MALTIGGAPIYTTTSQADGSYLLAGVQPGLY